VRIRDATPDDAEAACAVLRASIIELCTADHGNDPTLLERWLANKRPEIVAGWIGRPEHSLLVAVDGGDILAVGEVRDAGEITLNYVAPQARFCGISRAMLSAATQSAGCNRPKPHTVSICPMATSIRESRPESSA